MNTQINESVSVITSGTKLKPTHIHWKQTTYKITQIGYHHTVFEGATLIHIFSVLAEKTFFKLAFNTKSLCWVLEEIYEES